MSLYWPLAISPFRLVDKLKIGWFLLSEPIWTYGKWVKTYEDMWVAKMGVKHAVMVSSGSTANELIALRRKWELEQAGLWPQANKVIFPVNTWISSVSVWINLGFEPVFLDVSPSNLNVTTGALTEALVKDAKKEIGTVFYTALLGFFNDLDECKAITEAHGARFLMDNCEASFSYMGTVDGPKSILAHSTCSTSIFFSHFTTSGTEGGLIFTESEEEADWYRMARSHGLTRGMPAKYKNPDVSPEFDFYLMGSNYRSSNLQAYMATLDFDRAWEYCLTDRLDTYAVFMEGLDGEKYYKIVVKEGDIVAPLALPILCHSKDQRQRVEAYLKKRGVLYRPIIGGTLLAHTAFKKYGKPEDHLVANWSHNCGLYVGLHSEVTPQMAYGLAQELNNL